MFTQKRPHFINTITTTKKTTKLIFNYYLPNSSSILIALLALVSISVAFVRASDANLINQLTKLRVTEILDVSSANLAQVYLHNRPLKPGDPLPARSFKDIDIPKTEWAISNMEAQHTLILLDLDRKQLRNNNTTTQSSMYNQFTTVNIPGHDLFRGQAIVTMEPPVVPCQPSIKHRILMLVFHQSQTIDLSDVVNISASPGQSGKRENFNLNQFINRHRLNLVAANVFQALGEAGGVCSGSISLHNSSSFQSLSSIVIAMVIVGIAAVINGGKQRF